MRNANKPWTPPRLVILARSNPEENVLTTCKRGSFSGAENVNTLGQSCGKRDTSCGACLSRESGS